MAIFGLVSAIAGFVKVRYLLDKAVIDNVIFRLHYRSTAASLFLCCMIISANNLLGDPINCLGEGISNHVLNTFCWITYTYTLPRTLPQTVSSYVAHPGLGNEVFYEEKRIHSYYQWVPFMLFFQGVLFYLPHWMWKQWEDGKLRIITDGLRGAMIETKQERQAKIEKLVQYLIETMHMHNSYAAAYFFCEVLNFVNTLGNIFFVDTFLGGAFLTYGTEVLKFTTQNQEDRVDPMIEVFPRVTKCTFHKFGPTGTIQKHDALCVLALNIFNEKIYIFLWFWLIVLAVLSAVAMLYSMAIILLPSTREAILRKRFKFGTPAAVSALVRKTQVGDFMMLHLLGQNMNLMMFNDVLEEFCRRLQFGSNSSGASPTSVPSAPSTLEMTPMYPEIEKYAKDTEI